MLRFIKNKTQRRTGNGVDLIKVVMPISETLSAETKGSLGKAVNKSMENGKSVRNGMINGFPPDITDNQMESKSPLYEDVEDVLKKTDGILGVNDTPEMGIDLDDLLREVERDLQDLTSLQEKDNVVVEDALYSRPIKPPRIHPTVDTVGRGEEEPDQGRKNTKENVEFDSDEDTRRDKKEPRDPRKEVREEHFSRDSFIEGNHDVMVIKDGVEYIYPTPSDSGSEDQEKPEAERSYGRSFRIDPKNPYGLKEVLPPNTMMTSFACDTPVTVSSPLLFQDTNLLLSSSDMPTMPSSVPIRNGSIRQSNGNGNRRVQFRDDSSVISNGNTVRKVPIEEFNKEEDELVVIEEGIENAAAKDDEDALSLGSEASDMSESDLRPRPLRKRRTIAIVFAWMCMVSNIYIFDAKQLRVTRR